MNLCTKCGSYYTKPGTCNCYATEVTGRPWGWPVIPVPYTPPPWTSDNARWTTDKIVVSDSGVE
jgi:hypothetical protein